LFRQPSPTYFHSRRRWLSFSGRRVQSATAINWAGATWLNPTIPADVYYLHAVAVSGQYQGKGCGGLLMRNALDRAQEAGASGLQLDVLSDNPAVDFYRALECVESTAPLPLAAGVPTEYRVEMRFPIKQSAAADHDGGL